MRHWACILHYKPARHCRVLSERGGTGRTEDFTRVKIGGVPPSQMIDMVITGNDGKMLEAGVLD